MWRPTPTPQGPTKSCRALPQDPLDLECPAERPTYGRHMLERAEALRFAVSFLERSQRDDEPPLAIDAEGVRESNGLLIAPYNSVQYLASRDPRQQLLDCWPILVDLDSGNVRFGTLDERHLWRNPPI
ncbi:hypothetical protein GCM10018966_011180 [Streptomyces yanii]